MWSSAHHSEGKYAEWITRSLITLKALTYAPTGGIVAAPTTSLPEQIGGPRNWDYRYCWLRDATLTLLTFMNSGYYDEAQCWRDWLLRAAAGSPSQLQIMYGLAGEKRLTEWELAGLSGYADSKPVRIGNAAADQLQLDVYGEVMDVIRRVSEEFSTSQPGGTFSARFFLTSKRSGLYRTKASRKSAADVGISRIRRSWHGWHLTEG
jgi:GH15 family glucan-1,4-alpha-glucosidase